MLYQRYVVALLLLCSLLSGTAAAQEAPRPNIVFILADDLGWTDLACQGSEYYETPNIDRLAAEGTRFTRYYASPNCVPSRAALLTGQYAPRTGMYTVGTAERGKAESRKLNVPKNVEELPLDRRTLADVLKGAGYATGIFGKWHLGGGASHHPSKRGFDEAIIAQGDHFDFTTNPPVAHPADQYHGDFMTDRAVEFIARHKADRFFLYLPHFLVHKPIDPKPELAARWKSKPPKGGHHNSDYAAMIQSLDESVGRVLEALETHGLTKNTLVIFTSDNGGLGGYQRTEPPSITPTVTDNAPLRGGKGTLYEGGVRVPFLVRLPGVVPAGVTSATPIAHVDLLPTLAAVASATLPAQPVDGVNLWPLFQAPAAPLAREGLYLHFPVYLESYVHRGGWRTTPGSFVIVGDWKLIEYFEDQRIELYNLADDPGEHHDRASSDAESAAALRAQLAAWRTSIGAAMPVPKP